MIQDVVLAAEQSYFTYIGTKALLAAQQTSLEEARTNLEAATQRHNVGLATIADLLQAQTALSRAQLTLQSTEGALPRRPLGIAVVGGLAFSQLITLYVTPVIYTYLARLQERLGKIRFGKYQPLPHPSAPPQPAPGD